LRTYTPKYETVIERVDTPSGRRYKTPEGNLYPSVTTIFSVDESPHLNEWRERVGAEEADKVTKRAAMRGTYIHSQIEYYLKGEQAPADPIKKMFYGELFKSIVPVIEKIGDVHALETPLYSDELQVAGTVDCIGFWDGKLSVIDFKTSSGKKDKDSIPNYWMQTAAYAKMWEERTGVVVEDLVILMTVDEEEPLVFVEKKDKWLDKFKEARVKYKNIKGI
jgi:ATP-dependent exoDNAse (exonuclease V) beta subunit